MDQPTPSSPDAEPTADLPRPPIWDEQRLTKPTEPTPSIRPVAAQPVVPPAAPHRIASTPPVAPTAPVGSATPAAPAPDITIGAPRRGPVFEGPSTVRSGSTPAAGETTSGSTTWPAVPPTAGYQTSPAGTPNPPAKRRRMGLVLLAFLSLGILAAASFLVGRTFGGEETATVPVIAAPTDAVEQPTVDADPTTPPATAVPATPVPTNPPQIEAPRLETPPPVVPDDAIEPVAAVANAVAPAVVLIQHELGQGSGIIYDEAGLILTNAHVVGQFTEVSVQLPSGIRVQGAVLGADANTDVAVIRIDTDAEFGVAPLAPESSVEVGQLAVAIGSPFGLEQTVTSGIVSAKGRVVGTVSMIQTDAPINPGNSGGALADRQGRVIGMNTSIRTDGNGGNVGVGFAIPSDTAKLIADRIIAGQSLEQGYLGVEGATPQVGQPGVIVTRVLPGTGAETAGVLPDDLITGFNNSAIRSMGDLAAAVRLQPPDAIVDVDVVRDGQTISLKVTLGQLAS